MLNNPPLVYSKTGKAEFIAPTVITNPLKFSRITDAVLIWNNTFYYSKKAKDGETVTVIFRKEAEKWKLILKEVTLTGDWEIKNKSINKDWEILFPMRPICLDKPCTGNEDLLYKMYSLRDEWLFVNKKCNFVDTNQEDWSEEISLHPVTIKTIQCISETVFLIILMVYLPNWTIGYRWISPKLDRTYKVTKIRGELHWEDMMNEQWSLL